MPVGIENWCHHPHYYHHIPSSYIITSIIDHPKCGASEIRKLQIVAYVRIAYWQFMVKTGKLEIVTYLRIYGENREVQNGCMSKRLGLQCARRIPSGLPTSGLATWWAILRWSILSPISHQDCPP